MPVRFISGKWKQLELWRGIKSTGGQHPGSNVGENSSVFILEESLQESLLSYWKQFDSLAVHIKGDSYSLGHSKPITCQCGSCMEIFNMQRHYAVDVAEWRNSTCFMKRTVEIALDTAMAVLASCKGLLTFGYQWRYNKPNSFHITFV